jgi:hypothetical protein
MERTFEPEEANEITTEAAGGRQEVVLKGNFIPALPI